MGDIDVLEQLIKIAKLKGVMADAMVTHTMKKSVSCRMQKLENTETTDELNISLRVIIGKKHACIATNQLKDLHGLFDRAVIMARSSTEDPYISLPVFENQADVQLNSLSIFDPTNLSQEELIDNAKDVEESALSYDKVYNSEGSYSEYVKTNILLANTNDFISSYKKSSFCTSISVIAKDGNSMEQGSDYSLVCNLQDLKSPQKIGKLAAERAVKRLHPKKVRTCQVPVVFDPQVSGNLLQAFVNAINGVGISNGVSFLKDKMWKEIFNKSVTIIDDPTMSGAISSYPFDDEGNASTKLCLVDNGKLNSWLLDTHSANKLHLASTGHANRSKDGNIKPSHSNLYMKAGNLSPDYIIKQVKKGIYVTDIFGFGSNIVTGDYSHGASGFWIEDGEISTPINEFTIASSMEDMFMNLLPANDLQFTRLINAPTIVVAKMTVAGR